MLLKDLDPVTFRALTSNLKTMNFLIKVLRQVDGRGKSEIAQIYREGSLDTPDLGYPIEVIVEVISSSIKAYFEANVDTPEIEETVYRTVPDVLEKTLLPTLTDADTIAYVKKVIDGTFVK